MSKHSHYHKDVSNLKTVDVYRLLELFGVTDQALGHAIKKLLCAGKRGAGKTFEQDVREAVDALNRRLQMLAEDDNALMSAGVPAAIAPEGWTDISMTRAPWAKGTRLDFLMKGGEVQNAVEYMPGMAFTDVACWRFSQSPAPLPKQYEHEATHRDLSGNRYHQDPDGRWMRWASNTWVLFDTDPKAVPLGLQVLPAYDGHD